MSEDTQLEAVLLAACQHGADSEPDHEVGDLQDCLRAAVGLLNSNQRILFFTAPEVKATLEWGGGE